MRIAWFTDNCLSCTDGGSALNDRNKMLWASRRGHIVDVITPQNIGIKSLTNTDVIIFSNIMAFPREIIKAVAKLYPYIFYHHDFNFFPTRLFYPMDKNVQYDKEFWLPLYLGAKDHIWLSPLHREAYLVAYPELAKFTKCVPSSIDTELWRPVKGLERVKNTVLGINCLEQFKGRYNVHNYAKDHPELNFTFVGQAPEIDLPNCKYLPFVPQNELPKLYSQFEYLIQLNDRTEPFCRVVAEAKLCGCKIIGNENVGALSWKFMKSEDIEDIRFKLSQVNLAFFEEIENSMGIKIDGRPHEIKA